MDVIIDQIKHFNLWEEKASKDKKKTIISNSKSRLTVAYDFLPYIDWKIPIYFPNKIINIIQAISLEERFLWILGSVSIRFIWAKDGIKQTKKEEIFQLAFKMHKLGKLIYFIFGTNWWWKLEFSIQNRTPIMPGPLY